MGEDMTSPRRMRGEAWMADTTDGGLEEAWSLLVHKIKVFQEHVEAFQQPVETTLNRGR